MSKNSTLDASSTALDELKLWMGVVTQTAMPSNGQTFTPAEKALLAQCCQRLAQSAHYVAHHLSKHRAA
ncbi:hypothetical protein ACS86_17845 [Vibrio alginolyticus]|nr:hypothetical protein ACS86_17845 [Vibrio alginolyticus]